LVSALRNLVEKEIKEMIRDPKILLSMVLMPLIIFPVMGLAINISQTALKESIKEVSVAVMDLDHGPMAQAFLASLKLLNVTIIPIEEENIDSALKTLESRDIPTLIVIPPHYSENLTSGVRGELQVYSRIKKLSISEGAKASAVNAPLDAYEKILVYNFIQQAFPERPPETVLDPITVRNYVIFKGRKIPVSPQALMGIFMSQSMGFPMVIMLLLISAMQIAATSISIEKEEKTLETLLSLPVGRLSILAAKLAGSVVVALAGALAALVGLGYYTGAVFSNIPMGNVDAQSLGLTLSAPAYFLLGIVMFITIISALALAICLASFSENVRSAQSLVGPLSMLIIIPSIVLMTVDIEILPLPAQIILYIIPYTHSILASRAAFMGDYFVMVRSILILSLFTVAVLYLAAKIFITERIVTARMPLERFTRRRRYI